MNIVKRGTNLFFFFLSRSIRSFVATLGPAGGKRGYAGNYF